MEREKIIYITAIVIGTCLVFSSCSSKKEIKQLKAENTVLKKQIEQLKEVNKNSKSKIKEVLEANKKTNDLVEQLMEDNNANYSGESDSTDTPETQQVMDASTDSSTNISTDNTVSTSSDYLAYTNDKYRFRAEYPNMLKQTNSDENSTTYRSDDGAVSLMIGGSSNGGKSIKAIYENQKKSINGSGKYEILDKNKPWFVLTGLKDGKIYYTKAYVIDNNIIQFVISYPKDRADEFNDIVTHIEKTFKPDGYY